jgi:hypothetical protein
VIRCRPFRGGQRIKVTVLGIHPIDEAPDPCHLVEIQLDGDPGERLDLRAVTQEAEPPGTSWQTPSGEHRLDPTGSSGRPLDDDDAAALAPPARAAFFFHYLRLDRPLLTPAGPLQLPAPTPRPARLRWLRYL